MKSGIAAPPTFVALDFETANYSQDSACALALVRVESGVIVRQECRLIRPPSHQFTFTYIHGIEWKHVREQPSFAEVWRDLAPLLDGADFLAAHNAPFDRAVLKACCVRAAIAPPPHKFKCTVTLARKQWNIRPTKLPDVCRHLGIPLNHHDAASDALACAKIVLRAHGVGPRLPE